MKNKKWVIKQINEIFPALNVSDIGGHVSLRDMTLDEYKERVIHFVNQLDEPETLSQDWIDENKVARINDLRKMTTSDVVPVEKLKNLLVPKQDKPVIPQFVAEWMEESREREFTLFGVFQYAKGKVAKWIFEGRYKEERANIVARAWLGGYEVEKEKLYHIKFSDNQYACRFNEESINSILVTKYDAAEFTEAEIKAIDERYWAFAEEVTE